jgi:arylsulfatase A-like enzyme
LACGFGRESSPVIEGEALVDLAEALPLADVYVDTDRIDFGEAVTRPHLLHGWSWDESGAGTFVWGIGERSSLWFYLTTAQARTVVLTCWAAPLREGLRQQLTVVANGTPISEIPLERQRGDYRVLLPAATLRAGRNELEFRYAHHRRGRDSDPKSAGIRPLAVAWDLLQIEDTPPSERPRSLREDGVSVLRLPVDSRVDYHLRARPGDSIQLSGLELDGVSDEMRANSSVEVHIEGDRPSFSRVSSVAVGSGGASIAIPVEEEQIVRVSLSTLALGNEAGNGTALRLIRPIIRTRAPIVAKATHDLRPIERRSRRPNIVIYTVDTLRADHLGAYGYSRRTSPNLDLLTREVIVFQNATAQTSWTRPAVASIFTGLSPDVHGVEQRDEALADSALTLAETLRSAGYETAGFVANGNITHPLGFSQGFDLLKFSEEERKPEEYADVADWLVRKSLDFLNSRTHDRPFFLYLHAISPHGPYEPPERYQQRFAEGISDPRLGSLEVLKKLETLRYEGPDPRDTLVSLYDAEIALEDERLGEFVDHVKRLSLWDDTLFIFLADHGEEFLEHGWTEHGRSLYAEQLSIPLVIKLPDGLGAGTQTRYPAQQIDVLPTILWYLDLPVQRGIEGKSLLPHALNGEEQDGASPIFATLDLDERVMQSVTVDGLKLIQTLAYDQPKPQFELYDVRADRQELTDLARERPIAVGYLSHLLRERRARMSPTSTRNQGAIGADVEQNLRALGYIQ